MIRRLTLAFLFIAFTLMAATAKEQSDSTLVNSPYQWERFSVNVGGFIANLNSDISLGSEQLGLGVNINLEDALGLNVSSLVLRNEVEFSFGKRLRHSGRLSYYGFFRNANKVLEDDLDLGDVIIPARTEIQSKYNMQVFKLDYAYSFYSDERVKLSATFGFFVMPISFSVNANGDSKAVADFVAPLPTIGLRTAFAVTPKFYVMHNVEILYLKIGDFSGGMTDVNIKVEYKAWNHFGLGLGLNRFQLNLTKKDADTVLNFEGNVKTGYTGVLLYAKYFF